MLTVLCTEKSEIYHQLSSLEVESPETVAYLKINFNIELQPRSVDDESNILNACLKFLKGPKETYESTVIVKEYIKFLVEKILPLGEKIKSHYIKTVGKMNSKSQLVFRWYELLNQDERYKLKLELYLIEKMFKTREKQPVVTMDLDQQIVNQSIASETSVLLENQAVARPISPNYEKEEEIDRRIHQELFDINKNQRRLQLIQSNINQTKSVLQTLDFQPVKSNMQVIEEEDVQDMKKQSSEKSIQQVMLPSVSEDDHIKSKKQDHALDYLNSPIVPPKQQEKTSYRFHTKRPNNKINYSKSEFMCKIENEIPMLSLPDRHVFRNHSFKTSQVLEQTNKNNHTNFLTEIDGMKLLSLNEKPQPKPFPNFSLENFQKNIPSSNCVSSAQNQPLPSSRTIKTDEKNEHEYDDNIQITVAQPEKNFTDKSISESCRVELKPVNLATSLSVDYSNIVNEEVKEMASNIMNISENSFEKNFLLIY